MSPSGVQPHLRVRAEPGQPPGRAALGRHQVHVGVLLVAADVGDPSPVGRQTRRRRLGQPGGQSPRDAAAAVDPPQVVVGDEDERIARERGVTEVSRCIRHGVSLPEVRSHRSGRAHTATRRSTRRRAPAALADRCAQHGVGQSVEWRRRVVQDHDPRAGRLGDRDDARDRVDLQRAADREHQVGFARHRERALDDGRHQRLPERDRVALEDAAAGRQGGSTSPARTRSSASAIGVRSPQLQHITRRTVPWTSDHTLGRMAGHLVQLVDVLGDQGVQLAAALELGEREVAAVSDARSTPGGRHGCATRPHGRAGRQVVLQRRLRLGGRVLRPHALRTAEVRMPESVEMPAPVSATTRRASAIHCRMRAISASQPAAQHSTMFTAKPPRRLLVLGHHVGAGLAHRLDDLVQAHVVGAVAAQRHARGVDGLHGGDRVALDARDLHQTADRVAGQPRGGAPCRSRRRSPPAPACHRAPRTARRRPSSRRRRPRPGSRPRRPNRRVLSLWDADRCRGEQEVDHPASVAPGMKRDVVVQHGGHDAAAPLVGAGHDASAGGVLLVDRQRVKVDPVQHLQRVAQLASGLAHSWRYRSAARRRTLKPPGSVPPALQPRRRPASRPRCASGRRRSRRRCASGARCGASARRSSNPRAQSAPAARARS